MTTGHQVPYTIVMGQIIGAYQGTNCYDVITDGYGRYRGYYSGGFTGYPGVRNGGGLQPNTFALMACSPGTLEAVIICPADVAWIQDPKTEPSQLITYPQVSGFRLNQGLAGQLYAGGLATMANYPSDVADDLVNGEWAISSPFGPGIGAELFRSFVRGGAMSGLYCFDSNLTRLMGLDFEFITLAQQDYDRRQGSCLTRSGARIIYPTESTSDQLPRVLEVCGGLHGGASVYMGPNSDRGIKAPRMALSHQYSSLGGEWVVESAGGIHLIKTVSAVLPEESIAPSVTSGIVGEQPLDSDTVREAVAAAPRSTLATTQLLPLPWYQHGIDNIQSIINKSRGGFDRLPVQWLNNPNTTQSFFTTYNKDMWRALPQTVVVTIDAIEPKKTFYVGRASISLNPDGSILFEDAWHSQILMSGGNIMLSAAHDIVVSAGRNIVGLAGNMAALRAESDIDISANQGRVCIKADEDLSLLGGNSLSGGVLIESKGVNTATVVGTGSAQHIGGVVLKSATGVSAEGATIGLAASGTDITMTAVGRVQVASLEVVMKLTQVIIYTDPTNPQPAYYLTNSEMLTPGILTVQGQINATGAFIDGNITASGSVAATGGSLQVPTNQLRAAVLPTQSSITSLEAQVVTLVDSEDELLIGNLTGTNVMNPKIAPTIGFTFQTSKQLETDIPNAFVLPESRWQTVARRGGHGSFITWTENPVLSVSGDSVKTSAFPGYENWTGTSNYRLHNADLCFDLATGVALPPVEGPISITDLDYTTLNGNFAIGNDL